MYHWQPPGASTPPTLHRRTTSYTPRETAHVPTATPHAPKHRPNPHRHTNKQVLQRSTPLTHRQRIQYTTKDTAQVSTAWAQRRGERAAMLLMVVLSRVVKVYFTSW